MLRMKDAYCAFRGMTAVCPVICKCLIVLNALLYHSWEALIMRTSEALERLISRHYLSKF